MNLTTPLIAFGLRQVLGESADRILETVERRFIDHSRTLPKALTRANDRAWQALAVALAGDRWVDSIKVFFTASGDEKGFREEVRRLLDNRPFPFEGTSADFRRVCLAELNQARKDKLLSTDGVDGHTIARQTADLRRFDDPQSLIDGACQAVAGVADELTLRCPNLAQLLCQRQADCPPLLAAAFTYFFRREVETNAELARGLTFDSLRQLATSQETAFGEVEKGLLALGDRFDLALERVVADLAHIRKVADETRDRVADLQARFEELRGEIRAAANRNQISVGRLSPRVVVTINNAQEQERLRRLWGLYCKLPAEAHSADDLMLLGDTLEAAALFDLAQQCYEAAAHAAHALNQAQEAEAHFKAFRDACQRGPEQYDAALRSLLRAAELDSQRFAPFPLHRYKPRRILGAGGFGTAILCQDDHFDEEVVIKVLHVADLDRGMDDVFREARALRRVSHPAVIGVRDCDYADLVAKGRPFIVMDYFRGGTLEAFVRERGALPPAELVLVAREIAWAMKTAHEVGVLHRDLKPDNVLVFKEGEQWQVKVIDFGLALRRQTVQQSVQTSVARAKGEDTALDRSVVGTIKYAPPEQMGQLLDSEGHRVPVGPYSDVYAFGKLCCYVLFKTTEPKRRDWASVPEELADVLERCTEQDLNRRLPGFDPVLEVMDERVKIEKDKRAAEAQRQAEAERQRQEREEAERQRREAEERQRLAEEQQRQAEQERQRREEEARRQEEAKREAGRREAEQRQRLAEEQRRQAEQERQRREEEAKRQEIARREAERLRLEREKEESRRRQEQEAEGQRLERAREERRRQRAEVLTWLLPRVGILLVFAVVGAIAFGALGGLVGFLGLGMFAILLIALMAGIGLAIDRSHKTNVCLPIMLVIVGVAAACAFSEPVTQARYVAFLDSGRAWTFGIVAAILGAVVGLIMGIVILAKRE